MSHRHAYLPRLSCHSILGGQAMRSQKWKQILPFAVALIMPFAVMTIAYGAEKNEQNNALHTASPIRHLIILLGENRTFDHVFGVYKPRRHGETVSNLLSKNIVK